MGNPVTINLRHIARGLGIPFEQVQAVLELLDEGNTVPFITRYRKDQTGGLDEEQIRQIQARLTKMRLLAERKQTILRSIEAQGKLTEKLSKQIHAANTTKRLEDLYLPYKPKKQTLATTARFRGLEPLATEILAAQPGCADLDARAADFVNPDRQVPTAADALLGAGHIIAEQFSERADLRQRLREILHRTGKLVSTQIGGAPKATPGKEPKAAPPSDESADAAGDAPQPPPTPHEPEPAADTPDEVNKLAESDPSSQSGPGPRAEEQRPPESEAAVAPPAEAQASSEPPPEQTTSEQTASDQTTSEQTTSGQSASEQKEKSAPSPAPVRPKQVKSERRPTKKEQRKKKAEEKQQKAFSDYFHYSEEIKKIPPHRVLAINRGERAKVLRVKIECDVDAMHVALDELCVPQDHPHAQFLRGCARDALARLILPGLEREARRELTEAAETHAVGVFARNLRNLLLQPPVRGRRVLAVDPGYRSGCKLVALDQFGNLLAQDVIFLVGRPERREEAKRTVAELVERFELTVVTIGNGTACRETENFFAELIANELKEKDVAYVIVNEAGASVYSTSRLGREEFPEYDATLRGAISIGRRLQDPLSELVKIDPANIGVGLYQHDVKAKHLRTSLDEVVESCVNYVGVDVNTASPALLRYVSGLNQLTARRVYEHRLEHGPFRNREELRQVPGFGEATFVQAAGFFKLTGGDNPLDSTWIHPESYDTASRVMASLGCTPADLASKAFCPRIQESKTAGSLGEGIGKIDVAALASELEIGSLLLEDILAQLARPGRDPREDLPAPIFKQGVLKLEDLTPGLELTGTVLNVVDFGAFVDIGMHDSGLVHVSQLANKFVRDPYDVIAVGDIVRVWVVEVDKERRRVSLTMIPPGTRPSGTRREGKPASRPAADRPAAARPATDRPPRSGGGEQSRPPRSRDKPRPKGPPRSHDRRPPKPQHQPRPRPKPATPITEEMKAGKAPMRTFGDLAQFYQAAEPEAPKANKKPEPKPKPKPKPPAGQDESQAGKHEEPSEATREDQAQEAQPRAPEPSQEAPPPETHAEQAEAQASGANVESPPSAPETPRDQPSISQEEISSDGGAEDGDEAQAKSAAP
ncbi:MAG: Tex-like N-terminal domain-containing protein [Planctomycetota bacterium]